MRRAFSVVKKRQKSNISRIPDLEERKRRLRETRERSIGNEMLLNQAVDNLGRNGIRVYKANSREEAVSLVIDEIGNEKLVVKSKSNLTKEIGLTEALESSGVEVIETDIGDRIIQLCGDRPSHPTGPASHLARHDIAEVLSAHFGKRIEPAPKTMVELIRDEISTYVNRAAIGITGANAVAAEEGAILLLHNEGNIIQVAMRPEKHIVLAGIDKIYPNLEEAINMVKLQTFYATGSSATSFINIISGPSQTADVEKQLVKGVHGPKEICLILVDNYRSQIANSEYKELLYCIGCGECLLVCPAYSVYGNRFGIDSELGGRGVIYSALSEGASSEADDELDLCLSCRKCQQNCPLAIDTPSMVNRLRLESRKKVLEPHLATACDFVSSHVKWIGSAIWLEALLLISKLLQSPDNG
ncbi:MAG TPA: lactate utilization protein [Dehalococcoidia bacterium]|nr:lactate utilization protein [Dehalococcoidia bacterium]